MVDSVIDLWAEVCLGGWSLKISIQPSVVSSQPKVRAYDPLPTEQWKRKKEAEIDRDWSPEKREKRLRPSGDRSVELRLGLCLQQSAIGGGVSGWGPQAEGCKNRRNRRHRASSPRSPRSPTSERQKLTADKRGWHRSGNGIGSGNPGVESCKSLFSGVDLGGGGVRDARLSPTSRVIARNRRSV